MERVSGWRPLRSPTHTDGTAVTSFARLARTHAFMVAGDTLVAIALAGSLFFSISPTAARGRVALYLLLTMAPFAVVAPLIGPAIDRRAGGRRMMAVLSGAGRAVICLLMIDDIDSLLLFPEAFAVLVLAKGYAVAKSALVPGVVSDESALVEANSKLTLISGIMGFVAGLPGAAVLTLAGAEWVIGMAMAVFAGATVSALRLPKVTASPEDRAAPEVRVGTRIVLAASSMAVLRAVVGFLAFLLAFDLRSEGAPAWWFGVVLAASAVGSLAGAAAAPRVRRLVHEEHLLMGALVVLAASAAGVTQLGGLSGATVLAAVVGATASGGKQAFDAIVQRDAPEANKARSFAGFETRFQVVWVLGAFAPVIVPFPLGLGYVVIAAGAGVAAGSYLVALRAVRRHPDRVPRPITGRLASRLPPWDDVAARAREAARSRLPRPLGRGHDEGGRAGRHPHP